jgi:DNA-binding transcriptional LysR family regulator
MRHFAALAEELSFGKAAERCNLSQPAFSISIRQLEDLLNLKLVNRTSRNVVVTEAGQLFYKKAKITLQNASKAYSINQLIVSGKNSSLRLGMQSAMLYRGIPDIIRKIESTYPNANIEITEMTSQQQVNALLDGEIDIGFTHSMELPEPCVSMVLDQEPLTVCLPRNHPLGKKTKIYLQELLSEKFIIFLKEGSPLYYNRILSLCLECGFMPDIHYKVGHWLTVVAMVSLGMGVSIVPHCYKSCGMEAHFITMEPAGYSIVQMVWNEDNLSDIARTFIDFIQKQTGAAR